jgi:hypothetical protein
MIAQLSLLRPPALELTERGRNVPAHVLGVYSVLLAHVRELRCRGVVAAVYARRPWRNSRGWSNAEVRKYLGIDRRHFKMLRRYGLISWSPGDVDLVVVNYHRSTECRDEEWHDHMRRLGRAGGFKSGKSRRDRLKTDHGSLVDPTSEDPSIRDLLLSISAHLGRSGGSSALDSPPAGGAHRSPLEGGSRSGSSEGTPVPHPPHPPSKKRPLWAPSVLKRVAPASPATVAHRVLRGRKVGPAPAAPPARLSARTEPIPRDVRGSPGPRPEALTRGGGRGPTFEGWYDGCFRRLGGNGIKRAAALALWAALDQSPAERRRCWAFTQEQSRRWRGACRPPNTLAFLQVWHRRLQRERVEQTRNEHPHAAGDLIGVVLDNLKSRRGA